MSTDTPRGPGRPPLSDDVRTMHLRLPAALLEAAQVAASREGMSVSEWVRAAMMLRASMVKP